MNNKTSHLSDLLNKEIGSFKRIDNVWRPNNLLFTIQTKELLSDILSRYKSLTELNDEFKKLDRSEFYLKLIRDMGFIVRRAKFVRLFNHLAFIQAISEFYSSYGTILRFLRIDQSKGLLQEKQPTQPQEGI